MNPTSTPPDTDAAQRNGAAIAPPRVRWGTVLVWFMRVMAAAWVAKGLGYWLTILGVEGTPGFENKPLSFQTTIVYFAVIDLVAAVGLWLTSAWGGVLWLLALMSHVILGLFFPKIVPLSPTLIAINLGLVGTYLTISWLASRDET